MTLIGALVTHTHQDHVGGSLESVGHAGRIPGVESSSGRSETKVTCTRPSAISARPRLGPGAAWTITTTLESDDCA